MKEKKIAPLRIVIAALAGDESNAIRIFGTTTTLSGPVDIEAWVGRVFKISRAAYRRAIRFKKSTYRDSVPFLRKGYLLHTVRKGAVLYWYLQQDNKGLIGTGRLNIIDGALQEAATALQKESRGKGLYPEVLRSLKKHRNTQVYSDKEFMTVSAVKMWIKQGIFVINKWRFRINPSNLIFSVALIEDFRAAANRLASEPPKSIR